LNKEKGYRGIRWPYSAEHGVLNDEYIDKDQFYFISMLYIQGKENIKEINVYIYIYIERERERERDREHKQKG
jgi:hypothetical protein